MKGKKDHEEQVKELAQMRSEEKEEVDEEVLMKDRKIMFKNMKKPPLQGLQQVPRPDLDHFLPGLPQGHPGWSPSPSSSSGYS